MSCRIAGVLTLTLACSLFALGQHGEAEAGLYEFNYHGDTWTGAISSFDQASFVGANGDGANPYSGVSFYKAALFGTTLNGGANGLGTVYEITAK